VSAGFARARRFVDSLGYGNVPIPLIAAGLIASTSLWFDRPISWPLVGFGAAGAFLLYQFDRIWCPSPEDALNRPQHLVWGRVHRVSQRWVGIAAVGIGVAGALRVAPQTSVAGVALGAAGLFYLWPVRPGRRRLKGHWLAKPLIVGGAWTLGGVGLPAVEMGIPPGGDLAGLFVYRFLFLLPNILLADWPDRAGDRASGLRPVAARLPESALRRWAQGFAAGAVACGIVLANRRGWPAGSAVDLVGPAIFLAVLSRPLPTSRWFYGVVLDLIVAWPLVAVAWRNI
jgi:4-hydroxybenzoate polyprenyltransferase